MQFRLPAQEVPLAVAFQLIKFRCLVSLRECSPSPMVMGFCQEVCPCPITAGESSLQVVSKFVTNMDPSTQTTGMESAHCLHNLQILEHWKGKIPAELRKQHLIVMLPKYVVLVSWII